MALYLYYLGVDFLLQRRLKQLEQQELLPLIGTEIVQGENDTLEELCGLHVRHCEHELGQVVGVGLQQVEEVLVRVQLRFALLLQGL